MLNDWLNYFYNEGYYNIVQSNELYEYLHIYNLFDYYTKKYNIKPPQSIIDFGCGFGGILSNFNNMGYNTLGIDASEFSIQKCLEKNINVIHANCSTIKINDKFDIALSWNTCIGHNSKEEDINFFNNVYEHLNNDGIFILMLAHTEYIKKNFEENFIYNNIKRTSKIVNDVLEQNWYISDKEYKTRRILYSIPELYLFLRKFRNIEQYSYNELGVQNFTKNSKKILLICRK